MKKGFLVNVILVVVGLPGLMASVGCDNSNAVEERLNLAEELMEERPDSALYILNGIDETSLRRNRIKARNALLKSMAMDKNYIDTVTFDVLQPAIDYYIDKGNPDERLRTYFYKGRIHRNAGDDDLAMESYLTGLDNLDQISDSLTLARMLVAQSILYYRQYQMDIFVDNNLRAAEIYGRLGKQPQQLQCSLRALTGEIILSNKHRADSLVIVCKALVNESPSLKRETILPFLKFAVNFGTEDEVRSMIEDVRKANMKDDMDLTLARAYSRIGEPEFGLQYLREAKISPDNILDSQTYWSVKTEILENMGEDRQALDAFRNYSRVLEIYHDQLFSNELLFAEKKHEMEIENMAKLRKRDNAIKWILIGVIVLVIVTALIYYRYRMNKAGRLIAESNAEKFRLEGDNQRLRAEKLASEGARLRRKGEELMQERDRLHSETEKLQKEGEALREDSALIEQDRARLREKAESLLRDRERLESEMDGLRSEAENLNHKIKELGGEQTQLKGLLDSQETLSEEARQLVRERIGLLNGLIAQALTNQEVHGKEFKGYIARIKKDRKGFQDSLVKLFEMTHPDFMAYLRKHDLTERELRYACLYALGMRGKEIGTYLDLARHYNISSEVRRKLGLDSNDRNLGPYLHKLMESNG